MKVTATQTFRRNYIFIAILSIFLVFLLVKKANVDRKLGVLNNFYHILKKEYNMDKSFLEEKEEDFERKININYLKMLKTYENFKTIPDSSSLYVRKVVGPFNHEFHRLASKILDKTRYLAFSRYGDGETSIILGKGWSSKAVQTNSWKVSPGNSTIRTELIASLKGHKGQSYYYGFRGGNYLSGCLKEVEQNLNFITYTNVFMFNNANLALKLLNHIMAGLGGDVVIFGNEYGRQNSEKFKTLKKFYGYKEDNMIDFESKTTLMKTEWENIANSYNNTLFIFSIGPLSCVAISTMWKANPHNRYIDFGSRTDIILKGFVTRSGYTKARELDNDGAWRLDAGIPRVINNYLQVDTRYGKTIVRDDEDTFW